MCTLKNSMHYHALLHSYRCYQGRGISGVNGPRALWEWIYSINCQWLLSSKASFHTRVLRPNRQELVTTTRSPQRDTLWIGMSVYTVFFWGGQLLEETPAGRPLRLTDKRHVDFGVFSTSCWSFRTLSEVRQKPYSHKVQSATSE